MTNQLSKGALLFCYILLLTTGIFYFPKWKQSGTEATISWDVTGYYMYLPALFIYRDIRHCRFGDSVISNYHPTPSFQAAFLHSSGNYVMKYSSGQAIMLSPFFFIGHVIALNSTGVKADGFSYPYQVSIGLGMLFYACLGLLFLRKALLNYFSDRVVALTLIAIVFASNYLDYAAINGGMTHNTLFTLYAILLYTTIRFYKAPTIGKSILIGALTGLATLTRPTEILSILIPLLWGISSRSDLGARWRLIKTQFKLFLPALICFMLMGSIQLIYWKSVSGQWLVYSYQNETFSWLKPHLLNCLFSYRSGWLTYSPVMWLVLPGLFFLFRNKKPLFLTVLVFSLLFMYICFAWDNWWYGGSLGQRAMVQSYPVLSFAIAATIEFLFTKKAGVKAFLIIFIMICTIYNLWLTHQAHRGGLFRAGEMTRAYFWSILGKTKVGERTESLLDNPVLYEDLPQNPVIVYHNNFDQDAGAVPDTSGRHLILNAEHQFSPEFSFTLPPSGKKWMRATADFYTGEKEWESWKMTQFVIRFYKKGERIKTAQIRVHRLLNSGEKKNLILDSRIPADIDRVEVLFWNAGSEKEIQIDNLKVIIF